LQLALVYSENLKSLNHFANRFLTIIIMLQRINLFQCCLYDVTGLHYVTVSSSVDYNLHMMLGFSRKEYVYSVLVSRTSFLPFPKSVIS
jgi:hypothetical protein